MERCEKCGKVLGEHFMTAYGEKRCEDCYDDYLMTDRGKVEYLISICHEDCSISEFDADFLGHVAICWTKYRDELDMRLPDIKNIEARARELGLLV